MGVCLVTNRNREYLFKRKSLTEPASDCVSRDEAHSCPFFETARNSAEFYGSLSRIRDHFLRERNGYRHSLPNPAVDCPDVDSVFHRPLGNSFGLPGIFNNMAAPSVVALVNHCGPRTVCNFVVAVVIQSLNRVEISWSWPHVLIESSETAVPDPPLTYGYPPPPVTAPCVRTWVETTLEYRIPDRIFRGIGKPVRYCRVALKATTGLGVSGSKCVHGAIDCFTANAAARPEPLMEPIPFRQEVLHRQSSECFPGQVERTWHSYSISRKTSGVQYVC